MMETWDDLPPSASPDLDDDREISSMQSIQTVVGSG
jgi:hypothetical protein